jgi:cytochrome c oxidase subunit 3
MSLLRRLGEKSWETPGTAGPEPSSYRPEATRVGLIVYLVVASFLFFLITSVYLMRMGGEVVGHGGHGVGPDWQPMPEPPLIWINTAVLILASVGWEVARAASRLHGGIAARAAQRAFLASGGLGILFLIGQLLLWNDYVAAGFFVASNPANSFFYLITAIHGLHILGGLFVWARALVRVRLSPEARLPIELCAGYWHFLLLIWLAMLALLIST